MDNSVEKKSKFPSIEGYQIEGAIGRTKSTVSFKATAESSRSNVQITLSTSEAYRTSLKPYLDESFPKITKALKLVEHPNVVPLLDAGYLHDMPFTVTPFYAAGSLKQFVGTARNWRQVFSILLPMADALAYCHDHGIIHRDVKPQNIVINDQGDLCLTNFSLLEPTVSNKLSITLTGAGECLPAYIAPEVWHGKYSPAVDQYSFGVLLYELLTATLPFDASNIVSLLVQQAAETVAAPSSLVADVPKPVDGFIEKILAGDPAARFENMRDIRNMMQETLETASMPQPHMPSTKPSARRQGTKSPLGSQKIPIADSKPGQSEQPKKGGELPPQEKPIKDKAPKKKGNSLIIAIFGILAAVILCVIIFLVGLLTDMRLITGMADRLNQWINSGALNALADGNPAVSMSTLIPLEENLLQSDKTPTPNYNYTLVVDGIGGATEVQYYESTNLGSSPEFWIPGTMETQIGSKGSDFSLPVAIETSDRLGVRLQIFDESFSLGTVHVYKSSEVELLEDIYPHINLLRGSVFVSTEGSQFCVRAAFLPEEQICVRSGQMLVENGRVDVKVWCLEGGCEIMRDGEWVNAVAPLTRTTYINRKGYAEMQSNTKILPNLVADLSPFNLECDSCMDVEALNTEN